MFAFVASPRRSEVRPAPEDEVENIEVRISRKIGRCDLGSKKPNKQEASEEDG